MTVVTDGYTYRVAAYEEYAVFDWYEEFEMYLRRGDTVAVHQVYTDLFVPNGTWVMERPAFGYSWLIGASWDQLRDESIDRRFNQRRTLYIGDRPFGFIQSAEAEWTPGTDIRAPKGWQRLTYAHQIHKGEIGTWGVPIPQVKLAREHPSLARKYHQFPRGRDQKRSPFRWARLGEVVAACELTKGLLAAYWPFVGGNYYLEDDPSEFVAQVRYGYKREVISEQIGPPGQLTLAQLQATLDSPGGLNYVWIRAGLAKTFMRLRAFGYDPSIMFPQPDIVQV